MRASESDVNEIPRRVSRKRDLYRSRDIRPSYLRETRELRKRHLRFHLGPRIVLGLLSLFIRFCLSWVGVPVGVHD